jgi:hypothetical protein
MISSISETHLARYQPKMPLFRSLLTSKRWTYSSMDQDDDGYREPAEKPELPPPSTWVKHLIQLLMLIVNLIILGVVIQLYFQRLPDHNNKGSQLDHFIQNGKNVSTSIYHFTP